MQLPDIHIFSGIVALTAAVVPSVGADGTSIAGVRSARDAPSMLRGPTSATAKTNIVTAHPRSERPTGSPPDSRPKRTSQGPHSPASALPSIPASRVNRRIRRGHFDGNVTSARVLDATLTKTKTAFPHLSQKRPACYYINIGKYAPLPSFVNWSTAN